MFNLLMKVCSLINMSVVLLEKSPFNITHSRSEIEWSGLLKCLATVSPLLSQMIVHAEYKDGRRFTYVVARRPDASVVHASGSGQLQANPHVAGPWLSPGKTTRRAVTWS